MPTKYLSKILKVNNNFKDRTQKILNHTLNKVQGQELDSKISVASSGCLE
jgi:hypothetical protein